MAGVYAPFGVDTPMSNIILSLVTASIFASGVAITLQLVSDLALTRCGHWVAVGLLLMTSFLVFYEVTICRVWEQPISAVILLAGWLALVRYKSGAGKWSLYGMAVLAGLGFLLTAAILPSLLLGLGMMLWTGRHRPGLLTRAIMAGLIVLAMALPWGVRNEAALGKFILTRSNFGLELALGNQPGALGPSSLGWTAPIHPSLSAAAAKQVQDVGEVAYMASMTRLALGWIEADPERFAQLTAIRAELSFFPSAAMVGWFPVLGVAVVVLLLTIFGALKLAACAGSLALRCQPGPVLVFGVLPLVPYWLTHLYLRYVLLTYFTSVVLITLVIDRAVYQYLPRGIMGLGQRGTGHKNST